MRREAAIEKYAEEEKALEEERRYTALITPGGEELVVKPGAGAGKGKK